MRNIDNEFWGQNCIRKMTPLTVLPRCRKVTLNQLILSDFKSVIHGNHEKLRVNPNGDCIASFDTCAKWAVDSPRIDAPDSPKSRFPSPSTSQYPPQTREN